MVELDRSKDTRKLFDHYTCRKPSDWSFVDVVESFDHDQIEALRTMPFVGIDDASGLIFGTFDSSPLIEDVLAKGTCEFVLRLPPHPLDPHAQPRYFYVNTEGYDYCRYVFQIDPAWVDVIFP